MVRKHRSIKHVCHVLLPFFLPRLSLSAGAVLATSLTAAPAPALRMFRPPEPHTPELDLAEDSTDESEREDEEVQASTHRYGELLRRALRQMGPDLEAFMEEMTVSPSPRQANGAGHRQLGTALGAGAHPHSAAAPAAVQQHQQQQTAGNMMPAMRVRRLYMHGFAPLITGNDIVTSLSQFGPIARFRLFQDPVSKLSLRAASIVYEDGADAMRALEVASKNELRLGGLWAPEARLVADPDGDVARRAYEAVVHAPLPALLAPPIEARGIARAADRGAGAGADPWLSSQQALPQTGMGINMGCQLCVSGMSAQSTPQSVKTAFDQFGRVTGFVGARHAMLPRRKKCVLCDRQPWSSALSCIAMRRDHRPQTPCLPHRAQYTAIR